MKYIELTYAVPASRTVAVLKKSGLTPNELSLDYLFETLLVDLKYAKISYHPLKLFPVTIAIKEKDFTENAIKIGNLLREIGLPLYDDTISLIYPVNHLGLNPLGLPLNWHHSS